MSFPHKYRCHCYLDLLTFAFYYLCLSLLFFPIFFLIQLTPSLQQRMRYSKLKNIRDLTTPQAPLCSFLKVCYILSAFSIASKQNSNIFTFFFLSDTTANLDPLLAIHVQLRGPYPHFHYFTFLNTEFYHTEFKSLCPVIRSVRSFHTALCWFWLGQS